MGTMAMSRAATCQLSSGRQGHLIMVTNLALLALLLAFFSLVQACIHDTIDHKMATNHQLYDDAHPFESRYRRRSLLEGEVTNFQTYEATSTTDVYRPIRITPYFDEATLNLLSDAKRAVIYKVISDAISRFQAALQVVPVQGKLAAQHSCKTQWQTTPPICKTLVPDEKCLEMPIPSTHFGATRYCTSCPKQGCVNGSCNVTEAQGVDNTDFLLYVRSATTDYCGARTLAYASVCQKDQYDRPTFGMTNFCPTQISTADSDYESQVATAMHEITHALGFSAQFFPYMRHPDGTPRTARDSNGKPPTFRTGTCPNGSPIDYYVEPSTNTVQHFTERGHVVAKMVTPNVAAFVKSHFGCNALEGAEIEQQDDSGCLGSHWEERIFEPEYMTPVDSFRNVFSALTLAFFEDSGWYRANTSLAERLHFGANRGCGFATNKCIDPDTGKSIASDHYCVDSSAESCAVDASSRSICSISSGRSIPKDYQYFSDTPTKGGDDYADFCPINVGYSYGDCSNPKNLVFPGSTTINILGESYCPTCKCTATTLRSADSKNWDVNSRRQTGCYSMRCFDNGSKDLSKSTIELTIPRSWASDSVQVNCTTKGDRVSVPGFSGFLTCPDPSVICDTAQAYHFVNNSATSGAKPGGTKPGGTGSGTVNVQSTSAAHTLHSKLSWTFNLGLVYLFGSVLLLVVLL